MNIRTLLTATLALCIGTAHAQRVANAEYFWDTDPGAGSATPMSALDGGFDSAVEAIFLETSTLPGAGAHTLGIRVRDQQNNWGPTFTTVVVVEPSLITAPEIKITQAEYFWDTDPGQGNATPMIAFDGDFNDALEAISAETSALPADGVHVLHVRAKDAVGVWSAPFRVVVEVLGGVVILPEIHVAAAEYYVNEDPGPGNGTPMLAVDNDFNAALEAIRGGGIPVPVIAGVNVLWLRAKDVNDAWGPSFGVVVNIDTTITGTVGVPALLPNEMRLSPNPARAEEGFTIAFDRAVGHVQVRVLDASGRVVHEQHAQQERRVQVALHGAAPGVYHVGVVVDGAPHWQRVVLQ